MKTPKKHYLPGMRSIKTAIAVFVCMSLYQVLHNISLNFVDNSNEIVKIIMFFVNRNNPIYACISSIIAMQSTIEDSWEKGKTRVLGTVLGGVIGLLSLYADMALYNRRFTILVVPFAVLFVIWFCNIIKKPNATAFAAVTLVIILIVADKNGYPEYLYAINRTIDTAIGVLIAMVVNLSFKKPQTNQLEEINDD